jgi:hypothetical protein
MARVAKKKSSARKRRARRIVTHAARVAAEELAAAEGEELEDPENPFGEEAPSVNNAPPPPPMGPVDKPSKPPQSIVDLGSPPDDPLAAQAWLHKVLIMSAADAAIDPEISAATRRRELRTIAAAAAKLMPDTRRYEAEQTVLRHRRNLEAKVRAKQGAKLRPIPGLTSVPPEPTGEPDA